MTYKANLFITLATVLFSTGFVLGQQAGDDTEVVSFRKEIVDAGANLLMPTNTERVEGANKMTHLYGRAAMNPKLTDAAIADALNDSHRSPERNEGIVSLLALQAQQNKILIEQNKRIIELLERDRK